MASDPLAALLLVGMGLRELSMEAAAVSELWGIARFKIHEGKLEEYKRLCAQSMEIVRTRDIGTLQYDTYFNEDQSYYAGSLFGPVQNPSASARYASLF